MVLWVGSSAAVDVHETVEPWHFSYFKNPYWQILAIEVLSVDDENASNASPPTGTVRVLEILRGEGLEGVLPVIWHSPIDQDGYDREASGEWRLRQTWKDRLVKGPAVGERFIVVVGVDKDTGVVGIGGGQVYRLTAANREIVLQEMGAPEREAAVQIPAFLACLVFPCLG